MTRPIRSTRQPTGKPSWPILLLAGGEKTGKTWAAAASSGSDLIDRTLWIGVGEDDPDEYGLIPGARFEIVPHDGTYRDILAALDWAGAEPNDGRPNLIVLDSATRLWELLCAQAQDSANQRAIRKARKDKKPPPDEDVPISMDLWNVAKDRWANVMTSLRGHQGPSIVTARLDEVTVLDKAGNPTKERVDRVKAEKSLPHDVGAIVLIPERGKAILTGVRSTRIDTLDKHVLRNFTVDQLWRDLGLAETTGQRTHTTVDTSDQTPDDRLRDEIRELATQRGWDLRVIAKQYATDNPAHTLKDETDVELLSTFLGLLRTEANAEEATESEAA